MALELNPITIQYNGEHAINLVFIGDGFTINEQIAYQNKVGVAIDGMFTFEPFNSLKSFFNIYSVPTISNDSGISVVTHPNNPVTPVVKDTYLGGYFNEGGLARLTSFTKKVELETELVKIFKNKVYVILISNTGEYGGSGEFPEDKFMTVTHITMDTQYNQFVKLMMHEFGHSFGGLADEYGGNCGSDLPPDWGTADFNRANITDDIVNNRKWDFLDNPQYFQGGNYCNVGWWRSSQSSLMRGWFEGGTTLDEDYNPLCKFLLKKRIYDELQVNKKTITYINNQKLKSRYSLNFTHNFLMRKNVRINSCVEVGRDIFCNNLWINFGAKLIINSGAVIRCKHLINNGEIINNGTLKQI